MAVDGVRATQAAIECRDLWKSYRLYHHRSHSLKERIVAKRSSYDEFWALKGVELEIPVGSTFGILGPNGSGKSTLLKVLARILTPDRGSIAVNGTLASLLELGTGFHQDLTGRENIYLGGALLGRSTKEMDALFDSILDFAGVEQFIDIPVKNYSTGMYARLGFALAISVEPEILLVDEVLSVGDASFQMKCFERITEFRRQGRTIVIVSHSLDTVRTLCEDAVWLDQGQVRMVGRSEDVVSAYLGVVHTQVAEELDWSVTGNRFGSGEAEITDLRILDAAGERTTGFRTGDGMRVQVDYSASADLGPTVSCGIAVFRSDSMLYVFGQNSREAGVQLDLPGSGTLEYTIPDLPLLPGAYLITVALHDNPRKVFDYHDRRYPFMVFQNPALPQDDGSVSVTSRWSIETSAACVARTPWSDGV